MPARRPGLTGNDKSSATWPLAAPAVGADNRRILFPTQRTCSSPEHGGRLTAPRCQPGWACGHVFHEAFPRLAEEVVVSNQETWSHRFPDEEWSRLEDVVRGFEDAWARGEHPAIDAHLVAAGPDR